MLALEKLRSRVVQNLGWSWWNTLLPPHTKATTLSWSTASIDNTTEEFEEKRDEGSVKDEALNALGNDHLMFTDRLCGHLIMLMWLCGQAEPLWPDDY